MSNIKFAVPGPRGSSDRPCTHVGHMRDVVPNFEGCEQCVAVGDTWVCLRTCMTCGQVGCCYSSKSMCAYKHADEVADPIACSKGPGEDWKWCYAYDALVRAEVS